MNKKQFKFIAPKILILIVLLSSWNITLAEKPTEKPINANTIMNAFIEFQYTNKYSDQEIQDRLEKIIDGEENFNGGKWGELLTRINNDQNKDDVSKNEVSPIVFGAFAALKKTATILVKLADKKFLDTNIAQEKMADGKSRIIFPDEFSDTKKYLKVAADILMTNYGIFKNDPHSEELAKLIAAEVRKIDLFEKMQDAYIECLKSYDEKDINNLNYKENVKKYEKARYEYEIEARKYTIYQFQKEGDLVGKYIGKYSFEPGSSRKQVDGLSKEQRQLEKEYEKKH